VYYSDSLLIHGRLDEIFDGCVSNYSLLVIKARPISWVKEFNTSNYEILLSNISKSNH